LNPCQKLRAVKFSDIYSRTRQFSKFHDNEDVNQ
jgi:hypothetical protein